MRVTSGYSRIAALIIISILLSSVILTVSINVIIAKAQTPPWAKKGVRVTYMSLFASHKPTEEGYKSQVSTGFESIVIQNVKENEIEFHRIVCLEDVVIEDSDFKSYLTIDGPFWIAMGKLDNVKVGQKIIFSKAEFTVAEITSKQLGGENGITTLPVSIEREVVVLFRETIEEKGKYRCRYKVVIDRELGIIYAFEISKTLIEDPNTYELSKTCLAEIYLDYQGDSYKEYAKLQGRYLHPGLKTYMTHASPSMIIDWKYSILGVYRDKMYVLEMIFIGTGTGTPSSDIVVWLVDIKTRKAKLIKIEPSAPMQPTGLRQEGMEVNGFPLWLPKEYMKEGATLTVMNIPMNVIGREYLGDKEVWVLEPQEQSIYNRLYYEVETGILVAMDLNLYGTIINVAGQTTTQILDRIPAIELEKEAPEEQEEIAWKPITYTTGDGIIIAGGYIKGKSSVAILFLHELGGTKEDWTKTTLPRKLAELGYGILAIDLRGHGESTKTVKGEEIKFYDFTPNDWAKTINDVESAINYLKREGYNNIVIVGSSIGANLALIACTKYSEVKTIIILSPGFNYTIPLSEDTVKAIQKDKNILLIYGEEDEMTKVTSKTIHDILKEREVNIKVIKLKTNSHGITLLLEQENLTNQITEWIKQTTTSITTTSTTTIKTKTTYTEPQESKTTSTTSTMSTISTPKEKEGKEPSPYIPLAIAAIIVVAIILTYMKKRKTASPITPPPPPP